MDPDVSHIKRWIEELEFGELSNRVPLQCVSAKSAWDPLAATQMEYQLDALLRDKPALAKASGFLAGDIAPASEADIESAVSSFFSLLPAQKPGAFDHWLRLSDRDLLERLCEFEAITATMSADAAAINKKPKLDYQFDHCSAHTSNVVPVAAVAVNSANNSAHDNLKSRFKSAKKQFGEEGGVLEPQRNALRQSDSLQRNTQQQKPRSDDRHDDLPEALKDFDKALVQKIESDILVHGQAVSFDDISGLEFAKKCVQELICWPMMRPDIFTGLRSLPKGLLLFGPPGTGKTLIGKAIANQTGATFFSISASSLTSKWIGEGEASVKTLFAVANYHQPSVVFIDEIDSLLCQRSSDENEATRRIKTEFLVQLDGAGTSSNAQVVILGATNRPQELDEAARRRLVKRLYVPLPDRSSRLLMLKNLLKNNRHIISEIEFSTISDRTEGFSGADISALCTEAAMCPLRELASKNMGGLQSLRESEVPPICLQHFLDARREVSASVSQEDLQKYVDWNTQFGTYRRME